MTRERAKELLPIISAYAAGKTVQLKTMGVWSDERYPSFSVLPEDYRIKPEPKRVPLTASDIPPVCWITDSIDTNCNFVVAININELHAIGMMGHGFNITYEGLRINGWKYSSDRKNWKPCWKEVEE